MTTSTLEIDGYSTRRWRLNDDLHRIDGPAVEYPNGAKIWVVKGREIYPPYSCVLTAAFNRDIPILEAAMLELAKARVEAQTSMEQINSLKIILDKHWPTQVHKILAVLFSDPDPSVKHLAFLLLGREVLQKNISAVTVL